MSWAVNVIVMAPSKSYDDASLTRRSNAASSACSLVLWTTQRGTQHVQYFMNRLRNTTYRLLQDHFLHIVPHSLINNALFSSTLCPLYSWKICLRTFKLFFAIKDI